MLKPIPAQMVNRPSEVKRRVLCSRYSECLEICLSKGWQGFSCSECQDFDLEAPGDTTHWAEQAMKSRGMLINAGFFPKWVIDRVGNVNEEEDFYKKKKIQNFSEEHYLMDY